MAPSWPRAKKCARSTAATTCSSTPSSPTSPLSRPKPATAGATSCTVKQPATSVPSWPPPPSAPSHRCTRSSSWARSTPKPSSRRACSSSTSSKCRAAPPALRVSNRIKDSVMSEQKTTPAWTRDQIAARVAVDIPDGAVVNLGIGLPTKVANHLPADREVILQSENGVIGMGPAPAKGEEDYDLINAGKQPVTLL